MIRTPHERNLIDSIEDTILLLYLLNKSGKITGDNYFEAKIKLMKLIFLAELETYKTKEKSFNFFYNAFKKGPCSQEVLAILDDLESVGLITSNYRENSIKLTSRGKEVLLDFLKDQKDKVKSNNKHLFDKIDEIIKEYGKLSIDELLKRVYALDITTPSGKKINVGEAINEFERTNGKKRPCFLIRYPNYKRKFIVSPEWIETLSVLCDPKSKDIVDVCYV